MFQIMNFVWTNNLILKYQMFTPSGFKDTGIRQFEFVAKTQFFSDFPFIIFFSFNLFFFSLLTFSLCSCSDVVYLVRRHSGECGWRIRGKTGVGLLVGRISWTRIGTANTVIRRRKSQGGVWSTCISWFIHKISYSTLIYI